MLVAQYFSGFIWADANKSFYLMCVSACVFGFIAKSFNSHLIFAHLQNSVRQIVGMFLRKQQQQHHTE